MSEINAVTRPPEPDFTAITTEELIVWRDAENRFRASLGAQQFLGKPDARADITWQNIALPGRNVPVRVYRPAKSAMVASQTGEALPLIVHVHGGGLVGTAAQCDWTSSYLAVQLPAVVISVEHRLIAPGTDLSHAAADAWDVLWHVAQHAGQWGGDPARIAVFGESFGALLTALSAIKASKAGLNLRAQVLVNPVADVTGTMFDYPSIVEYGYDPSRARPLLEFLRQLAVPAGIDARACSPIYADDVGGLPPTLVIVPTQDALADHGRRYAERLEAAEVGVRMSSYAGAKHAFLTLPGLEPQAETAQAEILAFLRATLVT